MGLVANLPFWVEPVVFDTCIQTYIASVRISEQPPVPLVLPPGFERLPTGQFGMRWLGAKSTARISNQRFSGNFHTHVYFL